MTRFTRLVPARATSSWTPPISRCSVSFIGARRGSVEVILVPSIESLARTQRIARSTGRGPAPLLALQERWQRRPEVPQVRKDLAELRGVHSEPGWQGASVLLERRRW